jgi:hypothetical protein
MKFFNTAGPVRCQDHYCLPPLSRFDLPDILSLIAQKKYFVLHAPRQSGKTSTLLACMEYLNHEGHYSALYINVEVGQAAREDVASAMRAILSAMLQRVKISFPGLVSEEDVERIIEHSGPFGAVGSFFSLVSERLDKPLVLMIDEVDSLIGDTLISLLRQIRSGYDTRPLHFPSSIILCGVRDLRDYRIHSERTGEIITGGSAFNIKAASLRLGNFSEDETRTLCLQHTDETGQVFEGEALTLIWELTRGQPWLVNALAYEVCFNLPAGRDRKHPVTPALVLEAKERLIRRRETHLDQLADKLREERVRGVIEPILAGETFEQNFRPHDVEYLVDLGLITQDVGGALSIANPIYQEIIPRELTWGAQTGMTIHTEGYVGADGRLRLFDLLVAFQQFFREHSGSWLEIAQYKEAGPQLLLQAFLQRIMNGGGQITREYGLGMGRTDLFILWPLPDGSVQRSVIECKVLRGSREATIAAGLTQVLRYADICGADEVYLVIFDRRQRSWDEKIFTETRHQDGSSVTIFGM